MRPNRLLIAGTVACFMVFLAGQTDAQPKPAEAVTPASSTRIFKSAGLSAVVTGMNVGSNQAQFQLLIKNERTTPVLISPIILPGSQETAATTTSGVIYTQQAIAGIASCNGNSMTIAAGVASCLKDFQVSAMTRLEPGDITTMNVSYFNGIAANPKEGVKISLVQRFLVRTAPQEEDSLEGAAKGKVTGSASIVTISFPLIPIGDQ